MSVARQKLKDEARELCPKDCALGLVLCKGKYKCKKYEPTSIW